ncbi:unnamed protein product [Lactuca saligna]|uniref:Uncharacterized protein n=1 Tax=Lactuca saligna TaxID=75948 RepID=A0AA35VJM1_LACSI|nr:unnamed protein product [Lactuca saligna]
MSIDSKSYPKFVREVEKHLILPLTLPQSVSSSSHPYCQVKQKIDFKPNDDQKVQYSIYILHVLFLFLKHVNEQHMKEIAIESRIQVTAVKHQFLTCIEAALLVIITFAFNVVGNCEMATLKETKEEVIIEPNDPGPEYLHGNPKGFRNAWKKTCYVEKAAEDPAPKEKQTHDWNSLVDGSILCPPKKHGWLWLWDFRVDAHKVT